MFKKIKIPLIVTALFLALAVGAVLRIRPALVGDDHPQPLLSAIAANVYPTPTPSASELLAQELEVKSVIHQAMGQKTEKVLAYLLYDVQAERVRLSTDRQFATAWLVLREDESGEALITEPGLAFAVQEKGIWRAVLPDDEEWLETLEDAPVDLLSEDAKQEWLLKAAELAVDLPDGPLGGYLLPWAEGKVVSLSQSVSHDRYTPSGNAHYAFDFYISKTMWEIHASKAGTVWLWKDDVPTNDNSGVGNYLVLQDTTTTPVTYQLYLHLAQYSIPSALKVRGVPVMQGQFIGIADNTGQSTGHHLHFHVHTEPNYYWGRSVDITFNDVSINGGRPRRIDAYINELPYCWETDVCLQGQTSYISGNKVQGDSQPPFGEITNLVTGQQVDTPTLSISAWGDDLDTGLKTLQVVAKYNGNWLEISPEYAVSPIVYEWDLCADKVPDGPVSLALRLTDWHGNTAQLAGLKHFNKAYTCPPAPPVCEPGPDQVALFTQPNYEGDCALFSVGDYPTTGAFPDDQAASLQVGSSVWVTLFGAETYTERPETFLGSDSNLSDNRLGLNAASSLRVKTLSTLPYTPHLLWPSVGQSLPATASLSLFWEDGAGALEFQARLGGDLQMTSEWQVQPVWHIGNLPAGGYTWQVRARNAAGEGGWSALRTLSISEAVLPDHPAQPLPYLDDAEDALSGWTGTGLWQRLESEIDAHSSQFSWRYGEGQGSEASYDSARSGDLTSPPVAIPALTPGDIEFPYLRFWSRFDTETQGPHWDQRWLQVSAEGEPFQNLYQLSDDPFNYWVQSPYIDLSAYAGQEVRLRFHFTSLDGIANDYYGWFIDDVSIGLASLPACSSPGPQSGGPAGAMQLLYGDQISGEICPPGEVDYYRFSGSAGDQIVVDIDAQSIGSNLDGVLHLLDADGASQLAFHDDELLGVLFDPHLGYRLPRDGDYYLKLLPWDHPGAGGSQYAYNLSLSPDFLPPSVELVDLATGDYLPLELILQVEAADEGSGISHVEFFWHSGDWLNADWVSLGIDWSGEDGWSKAFTSAEQQSGVAFYVRVYDWAGNCTGAGAWDLSLSQMPGRRTYLPVISR